MRRRVPILALALPAALAVAVAPAAAATGLSGAAPAPEFAPHRVVLKFEGEPHGSAVRLPGGVGVRRATAVLRRNAHIAYVAPDYVARASDLSGNGIPNDRGTLVPPGTVSGWAEKQWNFLPWEGEETETLPVSPGGIDAVGAWANLIDAGRPGAAGVRVAVLDTGIAYRSWGKRFRRSPDFAPRQFMRGYDFVDRDRLPLDQNGHGTHVAGTIAERTDNHIGLAGLAYRAKLLPVRVLNRHGSGLASEIARGIRFSVARGADVINMSFNFGCGKRVPGINEELRRAYRRGVVVVASVGNLGSESCVSPPATGPRAIGVGGTTEGGCLGSYSLPGKAVDVLAPGGGPPIPSCPSVSSRPIYQVTLRGGSTRVFGEPATYAGTSMAAAHVSGVAAMILASGVLKQDAGPRGTVNRLTRRLLSTARGLGLPARRQGTGLIDAARATSPSPEVP